MMMSIIDSAIGKRQISKKWTAALIVLLICHPLPSQAREVASKVQEKEAMKTGPGLETPTPRLLDQALIAATPAKLDRDVMVTRDADEEPNAGQVPLDRQKRALGLFAFCRGPTTKDAGTHLPPCVSSLIKKLPLKDHLKKHLIPWLRFG